MNDQQPVVDETKVSATPETQVDSARNDGTDLDTLLAEFNQQTAPKTDPVSPPQTQQQPVQPDPLVTRLYQRFEKEDISKLVKDVKGDLDEDDEMVEAWVDAKARRDPRLQQAWMEREAKPQAFQKIAKELGREFAKRASKRPDPQATEDRNAVAAAVRGASTNRVPDAQAPNHSMQNNAEFRKSVRENYGFDPGV